MQRIEIIGRLGKDAEVRDVSNSNQVIGFSVAVSESYTKKDGEKVTNTIWFECSRFTNNTAVAPHLKKGTLVFISGKVNNRVWEKSTGEYQLINGINVMEIELLGSVSDNQNSSQKPQKEQHAGDEFLDPNFGKEEHDDLPF